ncbi:DUF6950 family protein [Sphingopyxis sp. PET50]|uniref:DUF6950 family protein n=1 Tax=Sphingopyxis sp. PET50 TaxID=2976533 RepID=UPI003919A000
MNLAERAAATQATWEKYKGQPHDWKGPTCAHVLRSHLRAMGYKPPKMPQFQSPVGARRALKQMGADDLLSLMPVLGLLEIKVAEMIVGDIAILPGDEGFDALTICAGNKFIGFHEESDGFTAMEITRSAVKGAFRV